MNGVFPHMDVCNWCRKASGCDCRTNLPKAFRWQDADETDLLLDSLNAPGTDGEAAVLQHAPYPADAPTDTPRHTPQPR